MASGDPTYCFDMHGMRREDHSRQQALPLSLQKSPTEPINQAANNQMEQNINHVVTAGPVAPKEVLPRQKKPHQGAIESPLAHSKIPAEEKFHQVLPRGPSNQQKIISGEVTET
jgi:hypothetical protein